MSDLKAQGNAAFAAGNYQLADELYAEALLELQQATPPPPLSDFATLHANRAAALLRLNRPEAALEEADNAVNKHLKWSKAHFRKAEAYKAIGRWREASSCMFEAARLAPNEASLKQQAQAMRARAQTEEMKPALTRLEEHVKATGTLKNVPVTPTFSQFTNLVELGDGNYSQVYRATFAPTKEVIALKVIDKQKAERLSMRHGNLKSELRAERRILSKLDHVNIVKLYTAFQDAKNIYYAEEYCAGRELWYRLRVVPPACLKKEWPIDSKLWGLCGLKLSEAKFFLAQIVNALVYLRKQGIVHRDLKPENVMLETREDDPRYCRVKLIDFGTARDTLDAFDDNVADEDKKAEENEASKKDDDVDNDDDDETVYKGAQLGKNRPRTHFVGTAEFMSPEAVHGRPADHRSDLWSFGCLCYQVLTGRTPFKGGSDYLTFLKADAAAYSLPAYFDPSGQEADLLSKMLKVDPKERVQKADELKSHPFFADTDFAALEDPNQPVRIPIPSLVEICVERLGEAIWVEAEACGDGPLNRKQSKDGTTQLQTIKKRRFEGEEVREAMGVTTGFSSKLSDSLKNDPSARMKLRGWLEQRSVMGCSTALRLVYGPPRNFSRVDGHSFMGYSQLEEGLYSQPFIVAIMDGVMNPSQQQQQQQLSGEEEIKHGIVSKLNGSKPYPRIVFVSSSTDGSHSSFLNKLREEIPIVHVPTGSSGHDASSSTQDPTYLSLWVGGILFIVVDAAKLADDPAQQSWLERELLLAKLCSRYAVMISNRKWMLKGHASVKEALEQDADGSDAELVPLPMRERFLREIQESNIQLIVKMGGERHSKAVKYVIPKANPNEPNLTQVETPFFPSRVRIIRLLPTDAVSDPYAIDELTGFFYLEKGELETDEEEGEGMPTDTKGYSSSSDSD